MASTGKGSPWSTYWTAFGVSFVSLTLAGVVVLNAADYWLLGGERRLSGLGGALALPVTVLSGVIAGVVCRHQGVSLATREVVVLTREPPMPAPPPGPVEVRFPTARGWGQLSWLFAGLASVVLALLLTIPSVPGTEVYGYLLAAGFGLMAAGCRVPAVRRLGFVARADGLGVTGCTRSGFGTRSAAWDRVGTCEVDVRRDALGRLSRPRFVFKDRDGVVVLRVDALAGGEQTGRFQDAVAGYLSAR